MKRGTRVYLWAHLSALDQHPHPPTSRINPLDHWRDRLLITCPKPEPRRRLAKISPTAKAPGDHKVTVHTAIDRLNTKARKNIQARGHVMTPIPLLPPNPRNMADNVSITVITSQNRPPKLHQRRRRSKCTSNPFRIPFRVSRRRQRRPLDQSREQVRRYYRMISRRS